MSLALSNCALFISLKQSVNGTQFLNINYFLSLFTALPVPVFTTDIVPLTGIYASL